MSRSVVSLGAVGACMVPTWSPAEFNHVVTVSQDGPIIRTAAGARD